MTTCTAADDTECRFASLSTNSVSVSIAVSFSELNCIEPAVGSTRSPFRRTFQADFRMRRSTRVRHSDGSADRRRWRGWIAPTFCVRRGGSWIRSPRRETGSPRGRRRAHRSAPGIPRRSEGILRGVEKAKLTSPENDLKRLVFHVRAVCRPTAQTPRRPPAQGHQADCRSRVSLSNCCSA